MENLDLHMTQLIGWAVQTLGKAILLATVIPGILALVGVLAGAPEWIGIGAVLAPIIFGAVLWNAQAPFPVDEPRG